MINAMLLLRVFLGVLFTFWLIQSIQFTVIKRHFRALKKSEFYLAVAFGTVIYVYLPPAWFIILVALYLYHFKIRSLK
jgi:hypothetical protein